MELARIEKEIVIVEMPNKLKEFTALENPKIRDYPTPERNKNTAILIDYLLNLLGVSSGKAEHSAASFDFINSKMGKWTYQEIKLAFEMYVAQEFDLSPFQQLNGIVVGNVMKCYENHLKMQLETYERARREQLMEEKEITEEEKKEIIEKSLKSHFDNWKETGQVSGASDAVYFELKKRGELPQWTEEEIQQAKEQAAINIALQAKEEGKVMQLEGLLDTLQKKRGNLLNIEARKVLLSWFYKRVDG